MLKQFTKAKTKTKEKKNINFPVLQLHQFKVELEVSQTKELDG